jgi:predicted enzyme related to lactoylglutathione lyase
MPRVVHFEIPADNPERAVEFYSNVFGWSVNKWEGPMDYWLIISGGSDEPGIDGAIIKREEMVTTVVNTVSVPSVDEFMTKVTTNGGKVLMPKTAVPGVGHFTYCQDTEGNMFGIIEEDESVK